jgi:outer membrane protein TolC
MHANKLLCSMILLISTSLFAQSSTVSISFAELDDYVRTKSPTGKIITSNYDLAVLQGKSELHWSNPELEAEYESVENNFDADKESVIAIGKNFAAPWARSLQRSAVKENVRASEYEMKSHHLDAVANAKMVYVDIQLAQQQIIAFEGFQEVIKNASNIANDRKDAGTISGLENQLIQMSLFNLGAQLLQLKREKRVMENDFRTSLGIADDQKLELTTDISFVAANLDQNEYYARAKKSPAFARFQHLQTAKEKQVRLEKMRVLPGMRLSGGYKNVNDDFRGYTVGLSLPLPVLNLNKSQIQQKQVERNIISLEYDLYKSFVERNLEAKFVSAQELADFLRENDEQFRTADKLVADLVFSFQEGWLELGDVLDGIQVYSESLSNYYQQLSDYYENIFDIEVMIANEIINL